MSAMSIIKRVLIDAFRRKDEFEPDSQDYKTQEDFIKAALENAKVCEPETYEEFKDR